MGASHPLTVDLSSTALALTLHCNALTPTTTAYYWPHTLWLWPTLCTPFIDWVSIKFLHNLFRELHDLSVMRHLSQHLFAPFDCVETIQKDFIYPHANTKRTHAYVCNIYARHKQPSPLLSSREWRPVRSACVKAVCPGHHSSSSSSSSSSWWKIACIEFFPVTTGPFGQPTIAASHGGSLWWGIKRAGCRI